mmetsp:Transcript_19044/g.48710  ORF Transcript_19044/g.48710 Transcript_19044/m.48710 type:complete len:208 (+) Transcript_19044:1047-1670(+)
MHRGVCTSPHPNWERSSMLAFAANSFALAFTSSHIDDALFSANSSSVRFIYPYTPYKKLDTFTSNASNRFPSPSSKQAEVALPSCLSTVGEMAGAKVEKSWTGREKAPCISFEMCSAGKIQLHASNEQRQNNHDTLNTVHHSVVLFSMSPKKPSTKVAVKNRKSVATMINMIVVTVRTVGVKKASMNAWPSADIFVAVTRIGSTFSY